MSAEAIMRVTRALKERLKQGLASGGITGDVFVGPLDDATGDAEPLKLFLYRAIPSATLRNREHRVPSLDPPPVVVFQNALPLDLYYLVTVGRKFGVGEDSLTPLGLAMRELQRTPELAVLADTVRVTLETLTTEESSRIWALFPTANYRTSVAYMATPVWIDPPVPEPAATPVVEDRPSVSTRTDEPSPEDFQ